MPRLISPRIPRHVFASITGFTAIALAPSPAFAADAAVLPEPSGLVLFGIGVAGVWLGRRFSKGKTKD